MTNAVHVRATHRKMPLGVALDFMAATINHSCGPNAFAFVEEGKIHVRSLREISAGEEVTISYPGPTPDANPRRKKLRKFHFFDCYCKWFGRLPAYLLFRNTKP